EIPTLPAQAGRSRRGRPGAGGGGRAPGGKGRCGGGRGGAPGGAPRRGGAAPREPPPPRGGAGPPPAPSAAPPRRAAEGPAARVPRRSTTELAAALTVSAFGPVVTPVIRRPSGSSCGDTRKLSTRAASLTTACGAGAPFTVAWSAVTTRVPCCTAMCATADA